MEEADLVNSERCNSIKFHKDLSYLVISDVHFFNKATPTSSLVQNVEDYFDGFSDTSRFRKLDIIFIAGDLFDDLCYYKHPDVLLVTNLIRRLMRFCAAWGIALRILEGTKSHDYKQAANFQPLADVFGDKLNYKYVQSLMIEKMAGHDLSILYMPDDWSHSAAETQRQVRELMAEHDAPTVNIGIFHGMFEHQIPMLADDPATHNAAYYLSIVDFFINVGHIHISSVFERILAQGSFGRISHGEEGPKGGFLVRLSSIGKHSFEFIENKNAIIFKTREIEHDDIDKATYCIREDLDKLPDGSNYRIAAPKGSQVLQLLTYFKKEYPFINFKTKELKSKDKAKDQLADAIDIGASYVPITLNKETIIPLILEEFDKSDEPLSENQRTQLIAELQALHH